jgi:hypothetical protein
LLTKTKIKRNVKTTETSTVTKKPRRYTKKLTVRYNCKVDGSIENGDKSDENSMSLSSTGELTCWNLAQNPEDGDAIIDEDLLDPFSLIP